MKIQCDVHRHSFEHRWTDHSKLLKSLFARGEAKKGVRHHFSARHASFRASATEKSCLTPFLASSVPNGGADRDRTGDPLLAKQVLSQLSYSPVLACPFSAWRRCDGSFAQSRTDVRSFALSPPRLARRKMSCARTRRASGENTSSSRRS